MHLLTFEHLSYALLGLAWQTARELLVLLARVQLLMLLGGKSTVLNLVDVYCWHPSQV